MTSEHLLDAMGLLDDDLIQETERFTVQKRDHRKWIGLAASFAVVLVLGYGVTHIRMGGMSGGGCAAPEEYSGGASNAPSASSSTTQGAGSIPSNEAQAPSGEAAGGAGISMDPSAGSEPSLPEGPIDMTGDWYAAIMVDGVLYWSTETPILAEVDESAIRTVTSYTDGQPEEDGQTNFDRGLTTRYAMTGDGLLVLIDDEWILFDPVPPWERP